MKRKSIIAFAVLLMMSGAALASRMICTGDNCTFYPDGHYTCENVHCTIYPD